MKNGEIFWKINVRLAALLQIYKERVRVRFGGGGDDTKWRSAGEARFSTTVYPTKPLRHNWQRRAVTTRDCDARRRRWWPSVTVAYLVGYRRRHRSHSHSLVHAHAALYNCTQVSPPCYPPTVTRR